MNKHRSWSIEGRFSSALGARLVQSVKLSEGAALRSLTLMSVLLVLLRGAVIAAPELSIRTDARQYYAGDTVQLCASALNLGEPVIVDVYVGLSTPHQGLWVFQPWGWSQTARPRLSGVSFAAGMQISDFPVVSLALPRFMPPAYETGEYGFLAALTTPGSPEIVSGPVSTSFSFGCEARPDVYVDSIHGSDSDDGSEASPFKTISHALASVIGSEEEPLTIHIHPGTYSNSSNGERFPLVLNSWTSLAGAPGDPSVLDGELQEEVILRCAGAQGVSIENLTITGTGESSWGTTRKTGAGVLCESSQVQIANCVIEDNNGTGIVCDSSIAVIQENIIRENKWGGIVCSGSSRMKVLENEILQNSGNGGIDAAGIDALTVIGNSISGNQSEWGGAIHCYGDLVRIEDNVMLNNRSSNSGGGICCFYDPIIHNNLIAGNYAGAGWGGGICCWGGSPTITNNTFSANRYNGEGASGDHIYHTYSGWPVVVNCIFVSPSGSVVDCDVTYSLIDEWHTGEGNIHSEPLFVSGPFGGYYLDPESPCIDAGDRSATDARLDRYTTQADGSPDTSIVDIGFHYPIPEEQDINRNEEEVE